MKEIIFVAVLISIILPVFSQIKSPEQFLGYPIGTGFTPHYRIVDYFEYVAKSDPDIVQLQPYGETNEHRPLLAAFISSKEHICDLGNIRINNLRLAGQTKGETTPAEKTPAIVWLSYNIHGNEAASSEAAMLTLYALTGPSNPGWKIRLS